MPFLTADNRNLENNAKYSFLSANYASARTTFVVENCEEFKPDDFILIGEFGSSTTEIRQISSIEKASDTITISEATRFPHPESTKVYIVNYDQVRFFHTTTTTFSAIDPVKDYVLLGTETTQFDITNTAGTTFRYTYDSTGIDPHITKYVRTGYTVVINAQNFNAGNNGTFVVTGTGTNYFEITNAAGVVESNKTIGTGSISVLTNYLDLDTSGLTTKVKDITNSTGYGWFVFYNSYTAVSSQNSNAIPYSGFLNNSVKSILDTFFSLLNNKELKLISSSDAMSWLNEGYSIMLNELNLVNHEFSASDEYTVTVASGIREYALPDNFSDLISVVTSGGESLGRIDVSRASNYTATSNTIDEVMYYIRDGYIGFLPTPSTTGSYKIRYTQKSTTLNSLYDNVDVPDNAYYMLKDFLLFRAAPKLNRGDGMMYRENFYDSIKRLKLTAISRDSNAQDSWSIENASNI